jgi:hypothetical protein
MRLRDKSPLDPEIAAQLDAIDATLAGEPVDPRFAEIAELALLVSVERPAPSAAFVAELDDRVARRFAPVPERAPAPATVPLWRRRWAAAGGVATALGAAAVAAVLVIGGSSTPSDVVTANSAAGGASSTTATSSAGASGSAAASSSPKAYRVPLLGRTKHPPASQNLSAPAGGSTAALAPAGVQPQSNGRKAVQSAQLMLTTPAARIDTVAQEAFDVIGQESGIVNHSSVTAAQDSSGYAQIQLSVPSGNLAATMTRLSQLRFANVAQRTDNSQDVNDQYLSEVRRLADAKALRASLLKQLAGAVTNTQIDSLNAQIHDAEATITSDTNALDSLNKQVNLSEVQLTISAGLGPVSPAHHTSGGFTLLRAAHDAGRVLVVVAGVALIALAVLLPLALLAALALSLAAALRRRARQRALDAA